LRAGVFLAEARVPADFDPVVFAADAFGAAALEPAAFDPVACVFAFFAGALAARVAFFGASGGGVSAGGVTRAS
jgi:hypothetical protein